MDGTSKTTTCFFGFITIVIPYFLLIFLLPAHPALAGWDFELADESRITIHVQNLDHKEKFEVHFLPPVAGKPLDISTLKDGTKEATFKLRGKISSHVVRFWINSDPVVTSTGYFMYPITFKTDEEMILPLQLEKEDGQILRYRAIITFIPPDSIHSAYEKSYQDILKMIFNFHLSIGSVNFNVSALVNQNITIFPLIGGRMTIEPKFLKFIYLNGWIFTSLLKNPRLNINDIAYTVFQGQVNLRYPIDAGNGFILSPELAFLIHAHDVVQNAANLRVGVSSYSANGIQGSLLIRPSQNWLVHPFYTLFFQTTDSRSNKITAWNAGTQIGIRVGTSYQLLFEYTFQTFSVTGPQTFTEQFHHFMGHIGTFF